MWCKFISIFCLYLHNKNCWHSGVTWLPTNHVCGSLRWWVLSLSKNSAPNYDKEVVSLNPKSSYSSRISSFFKLFLEWHVGKVTEVKAKYFMS
jgi:hypothetical protein